MEKFSFYEGDITKPIPTKTITIPKAIEIIKSKKYAEQINIIRKEPDKQKRKKLKEALVSFTFGGEFKRRSIEGLEKASGLLSLDIDDIERLEELKKKLFNDEYTHLCFNSPGGKGLKLIVRIPRVENDEEYKVYWKAVSNHYNIKENDAAAKDISRACYISQDENLFYNPDSKQFPKIIVEHTEDVQEHKNTTKEFLEEEILPKLKPEIKELISNPEEHRYTSRSERDIAIIDHLLLRGYREYVRSIFDFFPIGDKYHEHPSPEHYINTQIKASCGYTGAKDQEYSGLLEEITTTPKNVLKNKASEFVSKIKLIESDIARNQLISDYCKKTGANPRDIKNELIKIIPKKAKSLSSILKTKPKKKKFWMDNLIPKEQLIVVAGNPENFKTQFVIAHTIAQLTNTKMGNHHVSEDIPKTFSYCLEMSEHQYNNAARCFLRGSGINLNNIGKVFDNVVRQETFSFDYARELRETEDYDIVTIDSFRRILNGKEEDSTVTNALYNNFLGKLKQAKKTIILVSHVRKTDVYSQLESDDSTLLQLIRGSSDIGAQLDSAFILWKSDNIISENLMEFVICFRRAKNRDGLNIPKATLLKIKSEIDEDGLPFKTWFEPFDIKCVKLGKLKEVIAVKDFLDKRCETGDGEEFRISPTTLANSYSRFEKTKGYSLSIKRKELGEILNDLEFPIVKVNFERNGSKTTKMIRQGIRLKGDAE